MIPDIYRIAPELLQVEREIEELDTCVVKGEECFRQLDTKMRNGLSKEDREANIVLIRSGKPLPDIEAEWKQQRETVFALRDAADAAKRALPAARRAASKKLVEKIKPEHDKLQRELFAHLAPLHATWSKLFAIKGALLNQGLGLNGLFEVDAEELLGVPSDASTEFNYLLREGAKVGYCKKGRRMMMKRNYETASGIGPLEYGGGGFITGVDGKAVRTPIIDQDIEHTDYCLQGYVIRWKSLIRQEDKLFWFHPERR